MSNEDLYKEIVALIKKEDIKGLETILAQNKSMKELPTLVDEDDNTIFHHLIKSGNISLMRASQNYERGFADSYVIKNKEDKTPYQCVADLEDEQFRMIATKILGPSWKQAHILNQFILYLQIQNALPNC